MKFTGLDLIASSPDATGQPGDPTRRLSEVVDNAVLFEELGFDGFAVGERHHVPFLSSAPPVVLSHIAAVTSKIRLFTGVTLLSVLDPVRVAEDYASTTCPAAGCLARHYPGVVATGAFLYQEPLHRAVRGVPRPHDHDVGDAAVADPLLVPADDVGLPVGTGRGLQRDRVGPVRALGQSKAPLQHAPGASAQLGTNVLI